MRIPFKAIAPKPVEPKIEKVNHFDNFKTGLEKIGTIEIRFTPEISNCELDDAIYHMSNLKSKVKQDDMANAFVLQACCELSSDNQIHHLTLLVNYLNDNKILNKTIIKKLLDSEEQTIIEDMKYDNPNVMKVIAAFRKTF
jgi:hypothetical protein